MPRMTRVVAPGYPHHIIQRGNRRQKVFFSDKDKFVYLKLMREQIAKHGLEIWAYCLLDNHVHFVGVPAHKESLRAVAETNRRYSCMVNSREGWRGYLWQGRFASFVMDEGYCFEAIRYVENNPVRARIVKRAQDYHFSSARYHIRGSTDKLVSRSFWQDRIKNWNDYLCEGVRDIDQFRQHARTGRPLGSEKFTGDIETLLGRIIRKQKPGPKPIGGHYT